jgi:hypothetical protein
LVEVIGDSDLLTRPWRSDDEALRELALPSHDDDVRGTSRRRPSHPAHKKDRSLEPSRRRLALAIGGVVYVAIAVTMFWDVLTLSVTRGTTCACSDTSLFSWFFEWPLVALSHGSNPFFSSAMFHPEGINLLSNTSVTAWSFLLLPVTAVFGPIASVNVALVAAPALAGIAAMWVAQRWVRSSLAAFLAGTLYAFSPLVLFESTGAHLMVTSLVVPPLVLACLDELLWRRRHAAWKVGVALGALIVLQFFSGTEMLVMLAMATVTTLVVLGLAALVRDRAAVRVAVRHAAPGLAVAAGLSLVLLAWPTYYALAGPGHFVGQVWPSFPPPQTSLRSFLIAEPGTVERWRLASQRFIQSTYLGPPLVITLLVGLIAFRRSLRLWAAVTMMAVAAWFALGQHYGFGAWHYLHDVPVLRDVMNKRFAALLFLPAGLALAIVVDRLARRRRGASSAALALVVGAACMTPFVLNAVNVLPYPASTVWEPLWYQQTAAELPPGQVILGFPFFNTSGDLLAVQALLGMRYAVVGGGGPESVANRQGAERLAYEDLTRLASRHIAPVIPETTSPSRRLEVRLALAEWGATYVVVPMAKGPNTSNDARSPSDIEGWLATILGPPQVQDAAWVWHLSR